MTYKPLLMIWTARRIPVAHHHFRNLTGIPKLWIYGHTEYELADAVPAFLAEHPEYTHATLMPDDGIVSQQALDSVLKTARQYDRSAVGGWSNCDFTRHYTNIGLTKLVAPVPKSMSDYGHLLSIDELGERETPFRAQFCGHTLLTMPSDLWLHEKTRLQPIPPAPGYASDYNQCKRLSEAGIELFVDPLAFVAHLKLDHLIGDTTGWKRLYMTDKHIEHQPIT
jgi:hypothetical protein